MKKRFSVGDFVVLVIDGNWRVAEVNEVALSYPNAYYGLDLGGRLYRDDELTLYRKKGITMNSYSWALEWVKQGGAFTRGAWKERGWYVKAHLPAEGHDMQQPFLFMVHEGGTVPWTPQQFDQFANDFVPYENETVSFA